MQGHRFEQIVEPQQLLLVVLVQSVMERLVATQEAMGAAVRTTEAVVGNRGTNCCIVRLRPNE